MFGFLLALIFCPISYISALMYSEIRLILNFIYSTLTELRPTTWPLLYHIIRFVTRRLRVRSPAEAYQRLKIVLAALSLGTQHQKVDPGIRSGQLSVSIM